MLFCSLPSVARKGCCGVLVCECVYVWWGTFYFGNKSGVVQVGRVGGIGQCLLWFDIYHGIPCMHNCKT